MLHANPAAADSAHTALNELVVVGKKVEVKEQGRNLTITNIKGSDLASAGTILDMMQWTPGVMLDAMGNLTVTGAEGSPLIYINGVKQTDKTKMELLSSTLVKKIEVIRDPGAEYPTGTTSVIRITTSVPLQDLIGVNVIDQLRVFRRVSNGTTANAFGSLGKVDFAASASFNAGNSRQSASYTETIIDKSGDVLRHNATEQQDLSHSRRWKWMAGATWHITKDDDLQIEYSGGNSTMNRTFANDRLTAAGSEAPEAMSYESHNRRTPTNHTLLGAYTRSIGESTLTLTATYNFKKSHNEEDVYLMPQAALHQTNLSDSRSDLWTLQGEYAWSFGGKDSQTAGVYGGRSSNTSGTDFTFTGLQNVNSSVGWTEMYYSSRFDLFKCAVTAGLRGRWEHQSSESNLNGTLEKYSKSYFNLVPNLSIWHRFSKNLGVNLSYKYRYSLPSFSQLRPSMTLNDLIFYETGNPALKIPRSHYVALVFNIRSFMVAAEYIYRINEIMDITTPIEGSDYFLVKPINMSGNYRMSLELSYNLNLGSKFRLYAFGTVTQAHNQYYYADELSRRDNLSASVYLNGSWSLRRNLSVFATAGYWSPTLVDNLRTGASCNISFGGNLSLLKSKLNLRLAVNDLLRRSVTPNWTSWSPNLRQTRINRYDTRGVTLTATYRFTMPKRKYSSIDNADDYDRM